MLHGNKGTCLSLNATVWLIKVFFIAFWTKWKLSGFGFTLVGWVHCWRSSFKYTNWWPDSCLSFPLNKVLRVLSEWWREGGRSQRSAGMSVPGLSVWFSGELTCSGMCVVLTPPLWCYQSSSPTPSHVWGNGPSAVVFSLEDLVRKPFMDELLITDLKRSGKYLSLAFLWVWRMDRLVARFSAISCQMATSIFMVWFSPSYNSPNGISHETHDTRFDAAFITRQQREGEIILSCGNTLLSCFISKCLYPTIFLHPHDACRLCRLKKIAEQRLIEHTSVFCPSCYVLFSALTWRENIFWIPNKTQQQD